MTKITIDRSVVEQVLDALRFALHVGFDESSENQIKKGGKAVQQHQAAITELRQALEHPAQQEPVAWADPKDLQRKKQDIWVSTECVDAYTQPLYTSAQAQQESAVTCCKECLTYNGHHEGCSHYTSAPASTPWVGLTDDEVEDAARGKANHAELSRAIEAMLKEKNA